MSKIRAKLEMTSNYDLFEMNECNRPLHDHPTLLKSMQDNGFMPSSPLHCRRGANGKLKIIRGHHRYHYAKKLGLPVYFVVDETNCEIFELEGGYTPTWSPNDFAVARARAGDRDCAQMLDFKNKHGLTLGAAASLVGGETAGSNNKVALVKEGKFRVADMGHANTVVRITDLCRQHEIPFSTSSAFVKAVSMAVRVPEFDPDVFCSRISSHPAHMRKRGTFMEYLEEIEDLYNYGARSRRLTVKFRAVEVSRARKEHFGKNLHLAAK